MATPMNPPWPSGLRLSAAALSTGWVVMLAWQPLVTDAARMSAALLVAATVLCATAALRGRGTPGWAVLALQMVLMAWWWVFWVSGHVLPTPEALSTAAEAFTDAVSSARRYAAPVPGGEESAVPMLLACGLLVLLALEALVGWRGRLGMAGLVLLVAYTVPGAALQTAAPWWLFATAAAFFLLTAHRLHLIQLGNWGHAPPVGTDGQPVRHRSLSRGAITLAVPALVAAVALPPLLPSSTLHLFDGRGGGSGSAGGVSIQNPVVDLRRDLQRPTDEPVLQITSPDRPSYLRLSVLTEFDGAWRPGDREVPSTQVAQGVLPAPQGLGLDVPRQERAYGVTISDRFSSTWLPTFAHTATIDAGDRWRYDLSTRDFLGVGDTTTAGAEYQFTDWAVEIDSTTLNSASPSVRGVDRRYVALPPDLSSEVTRLSEQVTADGDSAFEKATLLQDWFRTTGGFRYDLARAGSLGSDEADLLRFLDAETGRVGYCEQFAAAMALMARVEGIPARVAIGFLTPTRVDASTWEYSAWDMHAWPELYFPGSGWVRFEPTPSSRASRVPAYTRDPLTVQPTTAPTPTPTPSTGPTTAPEPPTESDAPIADASSNPRLSGRVLWTGLAGVGLAAAMLTPRMLRTRQRRRRLGQGALGAWEELRATLVDLHITWPQGRSPRQVGALLESHLADPRAPRRRGVSASTGRSAAPLQAASLDRVVEAVERARYAPIQPSADPSWSTDPVMDVVASLSAAVRPRTARLARWWPRSVFATTKGAPRRGQ